MPNESTCLFDGTTLYDELDTQYQVVHRLVNAIPEPEFVAAEPGALLAHVMEQCSIRPLVLDVAGMQVQAAAGQLRCCIPFKGDAVLWQMRPQARNGIKTYGDVDAKNGNLTLTFNSPPNAGADWPDKEMQRQISLIGDALASQTVMLEDYHRQLAIRVELAANRRVQLNQL